MAGIVVCTGSRLRTLAAMIDDDGELDTVLVGLFRGNLTPQPTDTLDKYTDAAAEANFTGYARGGAITWTGPFLDVNEVAFVLGNVIEFPAAAPGEGDEFVDNVVRGYFVYRGTDLIYAERFSAADGSDAPQTIEDEHNVALCVPRFSWGQ